MEKEICSCGKPSMHETSSWWKNPPIAYKCCECHIREGGIPADWHKDCMKAYREKMEKSKSGLNK